MDIMQARVALRERSMLDVLDLVVRFVVSHKGAYGRVALAVLVPAFVVSLASAWALGWGLTWFFVVLLASFASAPFTALASRLVFAQEVTTGEALKVSLRAVPRLIAVRIVQLMANGLALLFLVVPVLWTATIMLFTDEVVILEQAGVGSALARSQRLAATQYGEATVAMLLLGLTTFGAPILGDIAGRSALQDLLQVRPPPSMWIEGGGWIPLLAFWIVLPFATTARFFVYLNFRTRSEGWDIQTRFGAIARRMAMEQEEAA
jgi:hypothetical protein